MDRIRREFLWLNANAIRFLYLVISVLLVFTISQFDFVQHNILGLTRASTQLYVEPYRENDVQLNYFSETVNAKVLNESETIDTLSKKKLLVIPKLSVLNETQVFLLAEKESNIALNYWSKWKAINMKKKWSDNDITVCSSVKLPKPDTIKFNNIYWQQFIVNGNLTLHLYNAYLDNRQSVSTVKIIAMTDNQIATDSINLWCYLWFDNNRQPVLSKVSSIYTFWHKYWKLGRKRGVYGPLYLACDIPMSLKHLVPKAVSLTIHDSCESHHNGMTLTHNLRVIYNKAVVRQEFGVCVKAFRFASVDYSLRLIEWLEMLKILGANKVFLYKFDAHHNMERVLQYYSNINFVDVRQLTLPDTQINSRYLYQWYFEQIGGRFWPQEMLELNDCLYRNIYNYKYIAIFDVDELIVPISVYNWSQLITQIQKSINNENLVKSYGYYENINSYVYKNLEIDKHIYIENESKQLVSIPSYMYTMRHVYRKEFTSAGINIKCFHNTDLVEAVHNHFPLKCLGKEGYHNCLGHLINTNHSFLFHFKRDIMFPDVCNKTDIKECAIYDTTLWKYRTPLDTNMKIAFQNIFHN